ncbi:hypothetical protein GOODEAATRI_000218 [Goodea atripinnis]|uniref:Uncharacterized protein n=1 Tax=Goodea atripinnis TaxID=208336 RepID=A0ABV0MGM3_9TELE
MASDSNAKRALETRSSFRPGHPVLSRSFGLTSACLAELAALRRSGSVLGLLSSGLVPVGFGAADVDLALLSQPGLDPWAPAVVVVGPLWLLSRGCADREQLDARVLRTAAAGSSPPAPLQAAVCLSGLLLFDPSAGLGFAVIVEGIFH